MRRLAPVWLALALAAGAQEPPRPRCDFLVPGLTARPLPARLPNINTLEYGPDGRLYAVGYDGRIHVLEDSDGDGLEDRASVWWDKKGELLTPLGIAIRPEGLYVAARGKVALVKDVDGDGRADALDVVASGWVQEKHNNNNRNDASGVALAPDGSLYFNLGCSDYQNAFLLDKEGRSHYSLQGERGTILKVSPDRSRREIVATGLRFAVSLAVNRHGDLFATDQEGDTWFPGGNPSDELVHIVPGRHYGFPFRHPQHLPDVVDEPATVDFLPQHQSTCGFRFNEAPRRFGPPAWEGDALVAGFSRGKLWRAPLAKTRTGYVGRPVLIASFDGLPVDVALSPKGDLVVACHGGKPDWGSGPQGDGTLWKLSWTGKAVPQPVIAWAAGPFEAKVAFDAPLPADPGPATIEGGAHVRAGDRHERIRPGYKVVKEQLASPRHALKVERTSTSPDRRTVTLLTKAHPWAAHYAVALPGASTEIDYALTGVEAAWAGEAGAWRGWLPHPTTAVAAAWTAGSAEHDALRALWAKPGKLTLTGRVTPPAPGTVLVLDSKGRFTASWGEVEKSSSPVDGRHRAELSGKGVLKVVLESPDLDVAYRRDGDEHLRPLRVVDVAPPWAPETLPPAPAPAKAVGKLAGGDPGKGREIFFGKEARCATCHTIRGEGGKVAADLTPSAQRDPEAVLRDIVEPSAAINPDFVSYLVELEDGRVINGVVLSQDAEKLVLVDAEAKENVLPRATVRQFRSSALSLMPDGFAKLGEEKLRDLVAFLCSPPGEKSDRQLSPLPGEK
jgi:putative heme-binding domain-containing protein